MNPIFENALISHKVWLESAGKAGKRLVINSKYSNRVGNYWTKDNRLIHIRGIKTPEYEQGIPPEILDEECLSGLNLEKVDFQDYEFKSSDLTEVTFRGASLIASRFEDCIITDAVFDSADLRNAAFTLCEFTNVSFRLPNIYYCRFENCKFLNCHFESSSFLLSSILNTHFQKSEFVEVDFSRVTWENVTLIETSISQSGLESMYVKQLRLVKCNLQDIDFSSTHFKSLVVKKSSGINVKWHRCELRRFTIDSSKFQSSDFSGSLIEDAKFINSDLSYAKFINLIRYGVAWNSQSRELEEKVIEHPVIVKSAIIQGCNLKNIQIESACVELFLRSDSGKKFRDTIIIMSDNKKIYPYRIFICHAHEDELIAKDVFNFILNEPDMAPWLDKFSLLPGQEWQKEIPRAIKTSDAVLILCSRHSMSKRGFVQREFKLALDVLNEFPSGEIVIIPIRLDAVEIVDDLAPFQWVKYDGKESLSSIVQAIRTKPRSRANYS